jgi:HlyD family secretion protein
VTDTVRGRVARLPRKKLIVAGVAALVLLCAAALRASGSATAQQEVDTATAETGNITVTVGGVGRVESATPTITLYPRASAQVAKLNVERGDRVAAGDSVAVLDDGGSAASAIDQAQADLGTAQIDLRQRRAARVADIRAARYDLKRTQADLEALLGGTSGARARALDLARRNVQLAQARLDQLLAPPATSAVRAAEAELRRAEAALATLLRPAAPPSPEVLAAAEQAVVVARQNLARAQASGAPAEISAAQLELYRAQAELAALQRPAPAPLPEEVAAANAAVESARANLDKLFEPAGPADVQAARLELQRARSELRQLEAGPSSASLAAARAAVVSALERLEQARSPFGVDMAREGVKAARARLGSARATEDLLRVRAPVGGVVSGVQAAPGSAVDPTTPIATIASPGRLLVTVDLSEFDVAQVEPGQKATVGVDALGGEEFPGTVVYVAPSGVDTGGVVTFPVQIALEDTEDVKPGMTVSASIVVAKATDVVLVPLEAVTYDDEDNASVTVLGEDGTETTREVEVGLENTEQVEIVEGVEEGEEVVLVPVEAPPEEE